MIPTGNIYLQAFNKASGRFIELPESIAALSFITTPTGYVSFAETANFSGFYFSRPIKINGSLDMAPINIGASNTTGSGSNFSANIGILNNNTITNLELATGGYLGNYNFGYANTFLNSLNSYNLGYFNTSSNNQRSFLIGASNVGSGELDSINIGNGNSTNLADQVLIFGQSNIINSGINIILVGSANTISKIQNNFSVGDTNTFLDSLNLENFGSENYISGSSDLVNFGDLNSYTNSLENTNFGNQNIYTFTSGTLNVGLGNNNELSDGNIIFGNSNTSRGIGTNIFGELNSIFGNTHNVYGDSNSTQLNDSSATIFGSNNDFSGTDNSTVYGSNNTLNSEILDLLYRVELTGITGAGLTGVTGYAILGNYNGIPGSGGNNNFLVGNDNQTSLNYSVYTFGNNNQILNNQDSYVVGQGNYAERSDSSYIFGQNNSVSGFQNYIIGNNNIVRSGDYNSILIGISHEFTGDFKVASVNIASVDSKIEISPAEIKLSSPNRAKFNNENITIASDLGNYLDSSNGLSNSGIFTSYTINDPSYTNLAAQIELQAFAYSGKEDRYYGGFSGLNTSDPNAYNFTGFFRKQPALYYNGLHSIYGDYYYQASNRNFEALFSRDIEPITGSWIISPKNSLGVLFYNKSTNTGVFPVSSWIRTGANTVTGYNPAPSFVYSSSFTGFFPAQKINSSTSYTSNYFNNFGAVAYSSHDEVAVIYGNHSNPQFNPAWLIIDKYSSGLYYINNDVSSTITPQTGWVATGYMGYTGRNPEDLTNAIVNTGIKISLGTRSGIVSSYDPVYGKIYIPFFY
jgi:hypothetical protein